MLFTVLLHHSERSELQCGVVCCANQLIRVLPFVSFNIYRMYYVFCITGCLKLKLQQRQEGPYVISRRVQGLNLYLPTIDIHCNAHLQQQQCELQA
jgi:hypothetical protein